MEEEEIEAWYADETLKKFEMYKEMLKAVSEKKAAQWYQEEMLKVRTKYLAEYDLFLKGGKSEPILQRIALVKEKAEKKFADSLKEAHEYAAKFFEKKPEYEIGKAQQQSRKEIRTLKWHINYTNFIRKSRLDYPLFIVKFKVSSFFTAVSEAITSTKKAIGDFFDKVGASIKESFSKLLAGIKALFARIKSLFDLVAGFFKKVFDVLKESIYKVAELVKSKRGQTAVTPQQGGVPANKQASSNQQPALAQGQAPQQATVNNPQQPALGVPQKRQIALQGNVSKGGEPNMEQQGKEGVFSKLFSLFKPKKQELQPSQNKEPAAAVQPLPQPAAQLSSEPAKAPQEALKVEAKAPLQEVPKDAASAPQAANEQAKEEPHKAKKAAGKKPKKASAKKKK